MEATPRTRAVNAAAAANDALHHAAVTGTYSAWCKAAEAALKATEACRAAGLGPDWVSSYEEKRRECRRKAALAFRSGGVAGRCSFMA